MAKAGKELYVGSLSYDITEYELEKMFAVSGTVTSIHLITDPATGQFKGCGYIRMSTEAEARDAIASLDGAWLLDKRITVSYANPQKMKPGGGGVKGRFIPKWIDKEKQGSSAPAKPAKAKPATAKPATANPAAAKPAAAKPAAAKPSVAKPAGAKPAGAKPAAARPAGTKPAAARPAAAKGAGARPAAAKPASSGPASSRPAGSRPGAAKPGSRTGKR